MKETTARIIVEGMASTSTKSAGVEINGIDVQKEKEMFTLSQKLIPGTGTVNRIQNSIRSLLVKNWQEN